MHIKPYTIILFIIFTKTKCEIDELSVYNISDVITDLLKPKNNERINNLKDKINIINKYVIDNEKVNDLIKNITKEINNNDATFYEALNEKDNYTINFDKNEMKNLYLKIKEKMNRDDIIDILNRTGNEKLKKSARRMSLDGVMSENTRKINEVLDKMIAESPQDIHMFSAGENQSIYWDPQAELEDLNEYHQHNARRIFRGERTTVRYYPFMVSIHVMGSFWCGGSIYWHDLVLTSAACLQLMHNNRFFRENPRSLEVRIASNHSRIGGEVIEALEVYFHPSYNPRTLRNNIAVIRLRRHLKFTYHRLPKIITISTSPFPVAATAEVLLLGWGVTKMSQKVAYEPIYLQRKLLPVYPSSFCKEVYGDNFITETMFCAGTITTGEGACDHDAGGPAVLAGKLVGIISFGPAVCGFPNAPTVFTLVGAFSDWIETINETLPEYYRGMKRTTTTTASPLMEYLKKTDIEEEFVINNSTLVDDGKGKLRSELKARHVQSGYKKKQSHKKHKRV